MKCSTASLHGADDGGVGGADAGHGDAGAEVDEGVAVDVVDDAAVGVGDEDRDAGRDAGGDDGLAALGQGDGLGAREIGLDAALLLKTVGDVMGGGGHGKAFLSVRATRGRVPWPMRSERYAAALCAALCVQRTHDVLDAGVVLDAVHGEVLAVAGLLEASVRHFGGEEDVGVDPDGAEVQVAAQRAWPCRGSVVQTLEARA